MLRIGLPTNEREREIASNDKNSYLWLLATIHSGLKSPHGPDEDK